MSVPEHCRPLLNDLLALVANGEQSKRRVYPALLRLEAALTKDTTRWDVVGIRRDLPERVSTWLVDHFPFDLESVQSRRARPKIKKLATEWHVSARHILFHVAYDYSFQGEPFFAALVRMAHLIPNFPTALLNLWEQATNRRSLVTNRPGMQRNAVGLILSDVQNATQAIRSTSSANVSKPEPKDVEPEAQERPEEQEQPEKEQQQPAKEQEHGREHQSDEEQQFNRKLDSEEEQDSDKEQESEEEGQPEVGRREDRERTSVTNGGSTTTMSSVDGAAVQSFKRMGSQTPSQTLESHAGRGVGILAEAKTSTNSLIGHRKSPQTINFSDDDEEDEEVPYHTPKLGDSGNLFGTCDSPTLVESSRSAVNRPVLIPHPAQDEPSPLQAKAALNLLAKQNFPKTSTIPAAFASKGLAQISTTQNTFLKRPFPDCDVQGPSNAATKKARIEPSAMSEPRSSILDDDSSARNQRLDRALDRICAVYNSRALAVGLGTMKETISEAYTPRPELLNAVPLSSTILLPLPSDGNSSAMAVLRNRADMWTIDLFDPTADVVSDNVQEMIESFFKHHLPEAEEIPKCILCSCPSLLWLADQAVHAFAIGLHALVSVPLPRKLPDRLWRLVLASVLDVDLEATEWKKLVPMTRVSPQPRVSERLPNSMSTAQQVMECMRIAEECRRWQSRLEIQMKQTVGELQQVAADVASVSTVVALLLRGGGAQTKPRADEEVEAASTRKELQDVEAHLGSLRLQLNEEMSDHKRLIKDLTTAGTH
ncbi:hypothetical protein N0V92_012247 [Colletotrichum tropicale]|nr:hypothetical protein N0V92_012247 [Colletotrichum tropicale]